MNAPLLREVLLRAEPTSQAELGLATEGVLRYVWNSQWGDMLIEVVDGTMYVNGGRVELAAKLRKPVAGTNEE